ncbi:hypothetical protein PY254_10500 [Rhodanobacter sp. AS-Z3]|nr:hypothetical protein [Rhodanobacter sp. AS-Z3]WEN13676.1 hypothetical protein PY254_10500 [Rhodanobacter sp. AS-Z3]
MSPLLVFVIVLVVVLVLLVAYSVLTIAAQNDSHNTPTDKDETP